MNCSNTLMIKYSLPLFFVLTSLMSLSQEIDYKGFPEWSFQKKDSTEYFLYTPLNVKQGERYPVALFLHGCCGEDYHATLRNTVDPPIRMWHEFGANKQRIPTYLIAPKTSRGWSQHIDNLKAVIDELIASGKADSQRIYITGFSMGGEGTWEFINRYPDYFAAALPMGMDFHGDPEKVKDVPVWTNKGETDWYARSLNKQVTVLRTLNGDHYNLDANWQKGVNPLFTEFKGVGHGVQWLAASTQYLVGWAYSKVNDGNKYPYVYFKTPSYKKRFSEGDEVNIEIIAQDPDGKIEKVELFVNGELTKTLSIEPFVTQVKMLTGDVSIEARAFDDKGKSTSTTTIVKTDVKTTYITNVLPFATEGGWYEKKLYVRGNGEIQFEVVKGELPEGLILSQGAIKGIPVGKGVFTVEVKAKDEDRGDEITQQFTLEVKDKLISDVVITDLKNYKGETFPLAKVRLGESLWRNTEGEVNFSALSNYGNLTFVQVDSYDTMSMKEYLSFQVDEPVIVYVGYETKDNLFRSTIPDWLKEFKKESGDQIVAQYFYYDVYSKKFPKGIITLPDAYEKQNGVNTNYVVIIAPETKANKQAPVINFDRLSTATLNATYTEQLTALFNAVDLTWSIPSGKLPQGLTLDKNGLITGIAREKGTFDFVVKVEHASSKMTLKKEVVLEVK